MVIDAHNVRAAAVRIAGEAVCTPLLSAPALSDWADRPMVVKAENLQRTGSFKMRGALNALRQLTEEQRAAGVIAASSGNHAQALAFAAQLVGTTVTVVMPSDAPPIKVQGASRHGAKIRYYGRMTDNRDAMVAELAAEHGLTVIPSSDHPAVMAGAGTVAREILDEADAVRVLLVPVGGGGLAAGCAVEAKARDSRIRVIGVEPQAGNDLAQSLRLGRRVTIPVPGTIADGLTHSTPGELPFQVLNSLLDDVVTVSDEEICQAMAACFRHLKLVVEPSGACAVAAAAFRDLDVPGTAAAVISGGNIAWSTLGSLLSRTGEGSKNGMPGLLGSGQRVS